MKSLIKLIEILLKKCINLLRRKKKLKIFWIFLLIFSVVRICTSIYTFNFKFEDKENVKEVMIVSLKSIEETKISYNVRYKRNNFILNIYSRNEEVLDKEKFANFKYADKIKITGKISIPKLLNNPNEFNYKKYLNSNNIVANINTYSASKEGKKNGIFILKIMYDLKEKIGKKIDGNLSKENAGIFKSMLYGDKSDINEDITEILKENGLSHIISVSGTNLSYLLMVFGFLFSQKETKKDYSYLYIIIIFLFVIFSSFSISIIRAGIMNIVSIIARKKNIHLKKFTSTVISFLVIFLYNPYSIFSTSTIFSYFAVISIILFKNVIESFLCLKLKKILKYKYIEKSKLKKNTFFFLKFVINSLSLYLAVQVLILPIQIYTYGSFSLTSIVSNVILTPIILCVFFIGFSCFIFSFIPYISNILFLSENLLLTLFIYLLKIFGKITICISLPKVPLLFLICYYIFVIILLNMKKIILIVKRENVKKTKQVISILVILYIIIVISFNIYTLYFENYVYFFNVEQGNMAFIRYKRKNILIDYGSTKENLASNTLSNFLKSKAIKKIDLAVISHMHDDHMNGLLTEESDITREKIMYSYPKEENENFSNVKNKVSDENISLIEANEFETYSYEGIEIICLSPKREETIISEDVANANSLVVLVSVGKKNMLFMGDATKETEKEIITKLQDLEDTNLRKNLEERLKNIDILQVGHHGSKTSTLEEFIQFTLPKEAIISAKKEKYGHPHSETLDTLKKYNVKIHITENEGAIRFNLK